MSTLVASVVDVVAPWAFLFVSILLLVLIPGLVRQVLEKSIPAGDRDVSVRVRLLLWLRIEIDVQTPKPDVPNSSGPLSTDPSSADVVPLREDVRESG